MQQVSQAKLCFFLKILNIKLSGEALSYHRKKNPWAL